jgi:hypothetical protein
MAVFWVVAPCSLVEVYQRFRGLCCLHHQGDGYFCTFMIFLLIQILLVLNDDVCADNDDNISCFIQS